LGQGALDQIDGELLPLDMHRGAAGRELDSQVLLHGTQIFIIGPAKSREERGIFKGNVAGNQSALLQELLT
jgi:hypothetical protein